MTLATQKNAANGAQSKMVDREPKMADRESKMADKDSKMVDMAKYLLVQVYMKVPSLLEGRLQPLPESGELLVAWSIN